VGHLAVQLAMAIGVRVAATVSTREAGTLARFEGLSLESSRARPLLVSTKKGAVESFSLPGVSLTGDIEGLERQKPFPVLGNQFT